MLKRDEYRCRVPDCTTVKRGKRSVAVHHRKPGISDPAKMITLCLGCHAKVTRTLYLDSHWTELLRVLWREQHPTGQEQGALTFTAASPLKEQQMIFSDMEPRRPSAKAKASASSFSSTTAPAHHHDLS